jgi:hypothetical protein
MVRFDSVSMMGNALSLQATPPVQCGKTRSWLKGALHGAQPHPIKWPRFTSVEQQTSTMTIAMMSSHMARVGADDASTASTSRLKIHDWSHCC